MLINYYFLVHSLTNSLRSSSLLDKALILIELEELYSFHTLLIKFARNITENITNYWYFHISIYRKSTTGWFLLANKLKRRIDDRTFFLTAFGTDAKKKKYAQKSESIAKIRLLVLRLSGGAENIIDTSR